MKTKTKKRIYIGIPVLAIVIAVGCISIWNLTKANEPKPHLSEAQIVALREQYPVCGIITPLLGDMRESTLEEAVERAETFVYGEVVGDYSTYYKNISTGHEELDAKRKANGISDVYEFYEYTINVFNDTEGKYTKGEQITLADNTEFMEYNPQLSDGMRVVVPIIQSKEKESRYYYGVNGMYYVTEDGYALSAFDEQTRAKKAYSGVKVEDLLEALKK